MAHQQYLAAQKWDHFFARVSRDLAQSGEPGWPFVIRSGDFVFIGSGDLVEEAPACNFFHNCAEAE